MHGADFTLGSAGRAPHGFGRSGVVSGLGSGCLCSRGCSKCGSPAAAYKGSPMKYCPKCKGDLPFTSFHKNRNRYDGVHYICKLCARVARKGKHRWKSGEKLNHDVVKLRAQQKVRDAVRHGKLIKPNTCEICHAHFPREKLSAHHFNGYDHPLDIQWLCHFCHSGVHAGFILQAAI